MSESLLPHQISRPGGAITVWVIYDRPRDYPSGFVLRPQFAVRQGMNDEEFGEVTERIVGKYATQVIIASRHIWYSDSAKTLRAMLPAGCVRVGPVEGDASNISEVWMDPT